jgi:hypothetical protein
VTGVSFSIPSTFLNAGPVKTAAVDRIVGIIRDRLSRNPPFSKSSQKWL